MSLPSWESHHDLDGHGDYVDGYAWVKRRERQAAHEQITEADFDRYLQLY